MSVNYNIKNKDEKVKRDNWFSVSPEGLSIHYKKIYIARELLANCFDEDATEIIFMIVESKTKEFPNQYLVRIIDNDPDGFDSIDDMFTLFRRTKKVDDALVRGRFNHGEKGVLSLCNKAKLTSTKGTVIFNGNTGEREIDLNKKTDIGSDLKFWIDLDEDEYNYLLQYPKFIKIPKGVRLVYDNKTYVYEEPKFIETIKLQTWKSDQKKPYYRQTEVFLYPQISGKSYLMELGIMIQRIDYPFTVDVRQKIPLDTKRNSVKDSFLEDLYGQLANFSFVIDHIKEEDMGEKFVSITLSSKELSNESAVKLVQKKMGSEKIMIANPFNQKANEKAQEAGYTLIGAKDIPKASRESIKEAGVQTTSDVFKENLKEGIPIYESDWNDGMKWIEKVSVQFAKFSINKKVYVEFFNNPDTSERASFGRGDDSSTLIYNMGNLGMNFFTNAKNNIAEISRLLIHELAHEYTERNMLPHISAGYLNEVQRIAGKMVEWLMIPENYFLIYDFVNKK